MSNPVPAPELRVLVDEWEEAKKQAKAWEEREINLRKRIYGAVFILPKEGVNSYALSDRSIIKGECRITRSIDIAALTSEKNAMREEGVPVDALVNYKPELVIKAYRTLDEKTRYRFDEVLVIKEGLPGLSIVYPKTV